MDKSLYLDHLNLLPIPGEAFFYLDFFDEEESNAHFSYFTGVVKQEDKLLKTFEPGDESWPDQLLQIRDNIARAFEVEFNTCQLNYYRDGSDSMDWHRDNQKELGRYPFIASVSFGASRIFQFRHYAEKIPIISVDLTHGSLLIMKAETQHLWEHRLPKTIVPSGPRINLTFRLIQK